MILAEPMTLATDYLVAACGAFWGVSLARQRRAIEREAVGWWILGFAAVASAALVGGTYHGFGPMLGEPAARALWKVTVFAAGFVGFAILGAAFTSHFQGRLRAWLIAAAGAKLVLYSAWMATHDEFLWVAADYIGSLLVALALFATAWLRRRQPAAPWIVAGILVSIGAAGVQASGIALHRHFNHNDLYHLIQIAGLYLFYRGALLGG
jgi:hypothetical protein